MIEGFTQRNQRFSGSGKAFNHETNVLYFVTAAHNLVEFDQL